MMSLNKAFAHSICNGYDSAALKPSDTTFHLQQKNWLLSNDQLSSVRKQSRIRIGVAFFLSAFVPCGSVSLPVIEKEKNAGRKRNRECLREMWRYLLIALFSPPFFQLQSTHSSLWSRITIIGLVITGGNQAMNIKFSIVWNTLIYPQLACCLTYCAVLTHSFTLSPFLPICILQIGSSSAMLALAFLFYRFWLQ